MYYSGAFFTGDARGKLLSEAGEKLDKVIPDLHVTFHFSPSEKDRLPLDLVGKEVSFEVIGEGNDGLNQGFEVKLPDIEIKGHKIKDLYKGAKVPNITVSLSPEGKAVKTAFLKFEPRTPFKVTGKMGYWENGKLVINKS